MNSAVLLLTWNAADAALACLHSLMQQQPMPAHILVVDNASHDGTAERIAQAYPALHLIRNPHNLGFSGGMNVGIRALRALPSPPDAVLLLNQDTTVAPDWSAAISAPLEDSPRIGAVGCKICYPDGTLQHAGAQLAWPRAVAHHVGLHQRDRGQFDTPRDYDTLTAAALALRMTALHEVGLFDTGYAPAYYEDADLCWRMWRAGWRLHYTPPARVVHQESLSIRDSLLRSSYYNRGRLRFVLKTYPLETLLMAFFASERSFIIHQGHAEEERALRRAYVETLLRLPEILAARARYHPPLAPAAERAIIDMLLDLKAAIRTALLRRARATLDSFYPL